ncbi:MAG: SpoIIE family protein phosphatase [Rhodospirillaceae bacterium]|nr:SpoIIE family protein phosphatase [Rhodospirillaceae bacterium]
MPGAFMSIIANSALEKALEEIEAGDVGGLITRMHQGIQRTLRQDQLDGPSDDGLELGVCFLTPDRSQVIFSGGRFSLFVIDVSPEAEVLEIKGDRKGIGYRDIPFDQVFTSQIIEVRDGCGFYMSSDGLIDQVGGERRRSFGKKRFKAMIQNIRDKPMSKQRGVIFNALEDYQGSEKRRDDVVIIGFKVL